MAALEQPALISKSGAQPSAKEAGASALLVVSSKGQSKDEPQPAKEADPSLPVSSREQPAVSASAEEAVKAEPYSPWSGSVPDTIYQGSDADEPGDENP